LYSVVASGHDVVSTDVNRQIGTGMDALALAGIAVDQLGNFLSGVVQGAGEQAGSQLYAMVSRQMRGADRSTLSAFEDDPSSVTAQSNLASTLALRFANDEQFRSAVAELVGRTVPAAGGSVTFEAPRVSASNRSTAVGGNLDQSNRNYGGLVVGAVAVIFVVIVVFFVGRAIVVTIADGMGGGLSGSSTCEEYLASSDPVEKSRVMKDLYLDQGKAELAADPFIIQNTEYFCGQRPKWTLEKLAAARG
jgi:hypothetical protein